MPYICTAKHVTHDSRQFVSHVLQCDLASAAGHIRGMHYDMTQDVWWLDDAEMCSAVRPVN